MDTKPVIYSIIGPNGAGKSTSARLLAEVEHFDFDAHLNPLMNGIDKEILNDDFAFDFYRSECIKDVQGQLIEWSNNLIKQKNSFSLAHNFFPGYNSNDPIVEIALQNGYIHKVIYLGIIDIAICQARVQHRAVKGEHYITPDQVQFRYERGLKQFKEIIKMIINKKSLHIPIHEIRILDYSKNEFVENIADYNKEEGMFKLLTEDASILTTWLNLLPELKP